MQQKNIQVVIPWNKPFMTNSSYERATTHRITDIVFTANAVNLS